MILGADKQNKNLRAASTIKVDSTAKTRTANHYSASVSSSKTTSNSTSARTQQTINHQSRSKINDGTPDPIRGSMEGLDNGKSTHIQMDNRGYDAKSLQTARYKDKNKVLNPVQGSSLSFTNLQNKSIMNNYSGITMSGSSSDRMSKNLRLNRMF
jgi:translation elongation factor P/translation initiation factor 5A